MAHYCHVIYACFQNMPHNLFARVNLRQITLLRGYIHPNGQPVEFIPNFFISLDIDDFISRMRRNGNRNVYNAGKMLALQRN